MARPTAALKSNPFAVPTHKYPVDLGAIGQEPYIIFDIRDGVATDAQSKAVVAIYMPPEIKVSYGANYEETTLPLEKLAAFIKRSWNAPIDTVSKTAQSVFGNLGQYLTGTNFTNEISINNRALINPHMAIMFNGVQFRKFNFNFTMMARNPEESELIQNIIFKFKYAMHPEAEANQQGALGSRYLLYPDNFIIGLFSPEDKYLFKISTCVLENMEVNYAGSSVPSFFQATGAPVHVTVSLQFKELEIMTKQRIQQGF